MDRNLKTTVRALIGIFLLYGCVWEAAAEQRGEYSQDRSSRTQTLSIKVDGLERHFIVHVPEGYDPDRQWPIVIMFHGGGGTAKASMRETGWIEKADREGFLAIFPEGTSPDPSRPGRFIANPQTWNDGSKRSIGAVERKAADVKFVSEMIEDLERRFAVDEHRIYVTGFSNGASMAFRLARELSSIIAAAAPVAGADWLGEKQPDRAVPLLYITGTADPLNPIEGGEIHIGRKSYGNKPSTSEMIARWAKLHKCSDEKPAPEDLDGAKRTTYDCLERVGSVVLYVLEEHGHHWPGGSSILPARLAGKNTSNLNATDVIWKFFEKHSVGTAPPQPAD